MILRALCLVASLAMAPAVLAQTQPCRQALALGLDVSGSVDAREYRLQLDGLAAALEDDEVRAALLALPETPVHVLVYEWSGPGDAALIVPWTAITDAGRLTTVTETLRQTTRRPATPGTALGAAMALGESYLDQRRACWRRVLDISGDGKSNLGPRPRTVKAGLEGRGVTINALVIGADAPHMGDLRQAEIAELSAYFRAEVIMGPEAFVIAAIGFEGYQDAMTTKLLRELDGLVLSQLGSGQSPD